MGKNRMESSPIHTNVADGRGPRTAPHALNIVLYGNSFLPAIGGRELVMHHLARTFQELGHRARVVLNGGWWRHRHQRYPYPVHRYPSLGGRLREQTWTGQLLYDLVRGGCDVLHAHATYPAGYVAARLKRIIHAPLVITPHGRDIHMIPGLQHGMRLDPRREPKIRHALAQADATTAISASIEAALIEAGAPPSKVYRVPNGVDTERFVRASAMAARQAFGLPAQADIVLAVGNYHPRKGHEVAIEAMRHIAGRCPSACLLIVGRGTEALRPAIEGAGLAERVVLTGVISAAPVLDGQGEGDLLASLFRAATLFVSAAVDDAAEGMSLAVLEAMAAQLPVVASAVSGTKDLVRPGHNGLLCAAGDPLDLASALVRVLEDSQLRKRLSEGARRTAYEYHWREIAQRYLAVYEQVRVTARAATA